MLVKTKRAALCSHAIFASDTHVLCIHCKLSDKQKICDLSNRCVECVSMSTIALALNSIVIKDFRKSGVYPIKPYDKEISISYEYDIAIVLEEMRKQMKCSGRNG